MSILLMLGFFIVMLLLMPLWLILAGLLANWTEWWLDKIAPEKWR